MPNAAPEIVEPAASKKPAQPAADPRLKQPEASHMHSKDAQPAGDAKPAGKTPT